jgi:catechol 2,3-dioxygenase-like lactoylglutathione lyase family enzyme
MVTPVFQVTDYAQAVAFYVDWLGFSIDWEDRPASGGHYFQVSRGPIVLHLTTYAHESCVGARALAEFNGLLAFHRVLQRRETAFPTPPLVRTTWNDKVMQLELFDPAGNCLVLAEVCA